VTSENRARNATAEPDRAGECLEEARTLRSSGHPYGAASRAYYAVFHGGRALLVSVGLEARSHRGVIALVGRHFVQTGRLSSDQGRILSRLQRDREDADYLMGALFTDLEAADAIANAEGFLDAVRRLVSAPVDPASST